MSSNHVYCTLIDKYGYLWLSTTDGVYRYNGYSLKKYDYNAGLPNVDVWNMYEDKQGKIWLLSIAQQIGYINNDVFKRVYKQQQNTLAEIYPSNFTETDGKIVFVNITSDKEGLHQIGAIKNDTLIVKNLNSHKDMFKNVSSYYLFDTIAARAADSNIYLYNINKLLSIDNNTAPIPYKIIHSNFNIFSELLKEPMCISFADKYYTYYKPLNNRLNFLNIYDGKVSRIEFAKLLNNNDEKILFAYKTKDQLISITDNHIVAVDSVLTITYRHRLDSLFSDPTISGANSTFFIKDRIWGNVLTTNNKGLLIRYDVDGQLEKSNINLNNFKYLNNINDTVGYWWNNSTHTLATINNGVITSTIQIPNIHKALKVVNYDKQKALLINETATMWLNKNNTINSIGEGMDSLTIHTIDSNIATLNSFSYVDYVRDVLVTDTNELFMLGSSLIGAYKLKIDNANKMLHVHNIDAGRYSNIVYNQKENMIICYAANKLLLINRKTDTRIQLSQNNLEKLGINAIEKILVDSNGNILIKDYNTLRIVNPRNGKFSLLFKNYRLEQAHVGLVDNRLFLAGNFGVTIADVQKDGTVITRRNHPNTKSFFYKYVYDAQFCTNNILLKTDNGTYKINVADSNDSESFSDKYRIILDYDAMFYKLNENDTFSIVQATNIIGVDVIKASGTGNLNIEYKIDRSVYTNSGNQIVLPNLKPNKFYTISIIASDDSWRSKPINFVIFVEPKWWQTTLAARTIFVLIFLLLIGVVYFAIVITKRIVTRNNDKRNQRRELELKSIYSQINPHFIFNSLSTALYFVKKNKTKEAYEHINQFSDLLRSYIKSSRNKYITITEELINLENYLQLQLTRFEAKFEYTFNIDDTVNPKQLKIPSLLLQPLVENALNHGIFHSTHKGLLIVSFKYDNSTDTLTCIIDDNGIGRKKSKEIRSDVIKKADSYGTILIKELIDTFNKYEKINIELEYIDKVAPQTGTTVIIYIKNITHAQ